MKLKKLLPYVGWILGLSLVVYLISRQPMLFSEGMKDLPLRDMIAVALFTMCANLCQGIRYYYLRPKLDVPFHKLFLLPFCMHAANVILPLRGGETVQPLFIQKWAPSQKLKSLIYWLVLDKALEFLAMLPFLALGAWMFSMHFKKACLIWAGGWLLALLFWKRTKLRPRNLPVAYVFATLSWVFNTLVFFAIFSSVQAALGLVIGTSVGSAIPGFPAAIGTYEYAFVWVSKQAGISPAFATLWAVASHSISILSTLAIGIPLGMYWGWPSEKDHVEARPQIMPKKHRLSNIGVYILGALTLILSGTFWSPQVKRAHKTS